MKASTIATKIAGGEYDDDLEQLAGAVRQRTLFVRDERAVATRRTLSPGDTIEIVGPIKPKYIVGVRGVIQPHGVGLKDVTINVTRGDTRRYRRNGLRVPLGSVRKVAS